MLPNNIPNQYFLGEMAQIVSGTGKAKTFGSWTQFYAG